MEAAQGAFETGLLERLEQRRIQSQEEQRQFRVVLAKAVVIPCGARTAIPCPAPCARAIGLGCAQSAFHGLEPSLLAARQRAEQGFRPLIVAIATP